MSSLPHPGSGRLSVGEHCVTIVRFAPARYQLRGRWELNRDSFGRTLYEALFADETGSTIRTWLAVCSLFRPDGSPSNYGMLHIAAGLGPYDTHEDLVGCELVIAVGTDRRGRPVVVGMRAIEADGAGD